MSAIGSGYDLSCGSYSRDGRIYQVEYAGKVIENSGTAIGARCKDGVVVAVEKIVTSKMLKSGDNRRVRAVDLHAGIAFTGLVPDARQLVKEAKKEAVNYRDNYAGPIPIRVLNSRISDHMHTYTINSGLRPFGASILIAGFDDDGPQLYMVEPSAVSYGYFAAAVGKGAQSAKTELEKLNLKEMTCDELVKKLAHIIYSVHDDVKDKDFELEMGWITVATNKRFVDVPSDVLEEAATAAKALIDAEDEDEDMDA